MRELNVTPMWGATYSVAGASWVVDAYVGLFLVDAAGTQFLIVKNTADTLYLATAKKPQIGVWATFSGATWAIGQYINNRANSAGVVLQSLLEDSAGATFVILNNTADTIVIPTGSSPNLPPGYILQGGARVVTLAAPSSAGDGWWQIVSTAGAVQRTSLQDTGAVTATDGSSSLSSTQGARSMVIDMRGIEMWSLTCGFNAAASSPSTVLSVLVLDEPFAGLGSNAQYMDSPGPAPTDPRWTVCPISVNGAASATSAAINSTAQRLIVPCMHPNSPMFRARWLLINMAPAGSPGTGQFTGSFYGTGP